MAKPPSSMAHTHRGFGGAPRLGSRTRALAARASMEHRWRVKVSRRVRAPARLGCCVSRRRLSIDDPRGRTGATVCLGLSHCYEVPASILYYVWYEMRSPQQEANRKENKPHFGVGTAGGLASACSDTEKPKRLSFLKWTSDNFSFAALKPHPQPSPCRQGKKKRFRFASSSQPPEARSQPKKTAENNGCSMP